MEFARQRGLWVMSDEFIPRMVYDGSRSPSFLDVSEPEDRLLVINSFSKNWAMTGWRLGWVVAPTSFGPIYEKMVQFNNSGVPGFIQKAGIAALERGRRLHWPTWSSGAGRARHRLRCAGRAAPGQGPAAGAAFYAFFSVEGAPDSMALPNGSWTRRQSGSHPAPPSAKAARAIFDSVSPVRRSG